MIECPHCRAPSPEDAAFCAACGRPLAAPDAAPEAGRMRGASTLAPRRAESAGVLLPPAGAAGDAPPAAAPALVRLRLNSGVTFDLRGKSAYLIGRRDDERGIAPDVELTPYGGVENGVSRAHAMLHVGPEGCLVEDLGSANETLLNMARLVPHQLYPIRDGDQLRLGRLTLLVVLP